MGRLLLVLLVGAVGYYYVKERNEAFRRAAELDKQAAELKRKREEAAGATEV